MKVVANKAFKYSGDGISNVTVCPGDEIDVIDSVVDGLAAEGFIKKPTKARLQDKPQQDELSIGQPTETEQAQQ